MEACCRVRGGGHGGRYWSSATRPSLHRGVAVACTPGRQMRPRSWRHPFCRAYEVRMNVEFVKDRRTRVLRIAFGAVLTALAAAVVTGIVTAPTRADRTASSAAAQRALTDEEAFGCRSQTDRSDHVPEGSPCLWSRLWEYAPFHDSVTICRTAPDVLATGAAANEGLPKDRVRDSLSPPPVSRLRKPHQTLRIRQFEICTQAFDETRVRRQAAPEAARVTVAASLADECTTSFTWTHPSDPKMCYADPTLSGCTKTCVEVTADG